MRAPEPVHGKAGATLARDAYSRQLGMQLDSADDGAATLSLRVSDAMLNGHGLCHGAVLFALADTAMAMAGAANGHVEVTVAAHIDFLAPARVASMLHAQAQVQSQTARTVLYDVRVTDDAGELLALVRGRTLRQPPAG
jgi:acyl-CoA thioesterase